MNTFTGVLRYEYRMSIRRWSLWLPFGILVIFYLTSALMPPDLAGQVPNEGNVLTFAGTFSFMLNLFMPVVGGILVADRLVRDQKLRVEELLQSTALSRGSYLAGKYFGALFSITTPVLLTALLLAASSVLQGAPVSTLLAAVLAFLGVNLPAFAFITAFSLACPLIIPVRVYQVLFTGYWFWGNYLSPNVMPTLNGTYLTASGEFVLAAFFGGYFGGGGPISAPSPSATGALINLAALGACAALALVAASRYLAWRAGRA